MATPRTRRLVKTRDASAKLNAAQRARSRLQKEAIKLNQNLLAIQDRLDEIEDEEVVHSEAIEKYAGEIADAHAEPAEGSADREPGVGAAL